MNSNIITFTVDDDTYDVPVEDIKKWVAALRSGEYKQGKGALQSKDGYCCLGVGCDIFIPKDKQVLDPMGLLMGSYPNSQLLAPSWLPAINLDYSNKNKTMLSTLNDNGKSFDEIADLIEKEYLK